MNFFQKKCLFVLMMLPLFVWGRTLDIRTLHRNDAQGVAMGQGAMVTVEGIVTATFHTDSLDACIQDETGGIQVISDTLMNHTLDRGNRVRLNGTVTQLAGTTLLVVKHMDDIEITGQDEPVPEPRPVTCRNVIDTFKDDQSEPNEGRLITIQNATITRIDSSSMMIRDYTGSVTVNIRALAVPPDSGVVTITGLVTQQDTVLPYHQGYEVRLRDEEDVSTPSSITIFDGPVESDLQPHSIRIHWKTDVNALSTFFYRPVEGIWPWQSQSGSGPEQSHQVILEDLDPATLYEGMVRATTDVDTTHSDTLVFCTASGESSGDIRVFFTRSVDSDYATHTVANGNVDLSQIIIDKVINKAQHSLDITYYSFTHFDIASALYRAKQRGVSIRMIYDAENESNTLTYLRDTVGLSMISDTFGDNTGNAAMHNKFIIADHRDRSSLADDRIWLGSANASYSGSRSNAENMLLIDDASLCAAYTAEFNEMWGSSSDIPNPNRSRMGARKRDNTPHRFQIGDVFVEQYMSPSDNTEAHIESVIRSADFSLYLSMLLFTSEPLETVLRSHYYSQPGLELIGIFDDHYRATNDIVSRMSGEGYAAWSPVAKVYDDPLSGNDLFHHKYMIVDAFKDSDPVVVTGSHNWTGAANNRNDENTLILHDADIARLYLQEFAARYQQLGASHPLHVAHPSPTQPQHWECLSAYPNPFNSSVTFTVQAPDDLSTRATVSIYNVSGQQIQSIPISMAARSRQTVQWEGTTDAGTMAASGIYFARVEAEQPSDWIKITLLK
jgi:phosphatidylserine/phosphatidylglycerophosphate/cardiolipin synthase-like enzyme/uncharacterized protein YdeI (BOF family)